MSYEFDIFFTRIKTGIALECQEDSILLFRRLLVTNHSTNK